MFSGAAAAALIVSLEAHASLILTTDVVDTFTPVTASTGTYGNDLPGHPSELYFGQLEATRNGIVDFFYIGNEAGYLNSLLLDGLVAHTTAGLPDNFNASYPLIGTVGVTANEFVDFGFCTNGGAEVGAFGRCASNDDASSLTAQFNYGDAGGYRSIAFRALTAFDPVSGHFEFGSAGGSSNLWMLFWDDSGAKNDDNHDDYIAVARFTAVPEPATALLLATGLAAGALMRRRRLRVSA
jgi:hypothetical protein